MPFLPPPFTAPPVARAALLHPARRRQDVREDSGTDARQPSLQQRNRAWLEAYAASRDERERLRLRNALVGANLPLVLSIAGRQSRASAIPYDDLVQVGSIGLIRAVEAFDPARRVSLSTFAVPFVRGAMQHELRDRATLLHAPRSLWELRQRAGALQSRQRRQGLAPLPEGPLAQRLGCGTAELHEALTLGQRTSLRSLDAPQARGQDEDERDCLLARLPDPRSLEAGEDDPSTATAEQAEGSWLQQRLAQLRPEQRELLQGRLVVGCTWVELGRSLGISPRLAQRRCEALLARLQREAEQWRLQRERAPAETEGQPLA